MDAIAIAHRQPHTPERPPAAGLHGLVPQALQALDRGPRPPAPAGAALLQAVLDHLQLGLVIVTEPLGVAYANPAARQACAGAESALRIDGGVLEVDAVGPRGRLLAALASARRGRWSLAMVGRPGAPLPVAVLPLPGGHGGEALLVLGAAAGGGGVASGLALQFFAQACGLTAAEVKVLQALACGVQPRRIAAEHGVALSTVRTQIGSIRAKTDTRSILDLVRLVAVLPPIRHLSLASH